ncbi:NAD(P)/FAD-dependent oxidoreductase [Natronoflexus pectinivorans]|uniref:Glycine/D-amino acid oxidase-like deaminating enzyme n=1 Tax=Natronoflexus pectinivorans TaxID=682526 RepID=A0A4R2GLM6_9BACT|nr:FAD-dependent oxidoreductase [Natronoflexus pectinivorans]TCO09218.1 glycine/D-amino acid oxidase-like deaminating enzyme [Natronoflexus pectinivorans]
MISTEHLIIGQGLAGSVLAWSMMERKLDFHVMDSPSLPKSSMVAAGLYNPVMFNKLRISRMAEKLWPEMLKTYSAIENTIGHKVLHPMKSVKLLNDEELSDWQNKQEDPPGKYIGQIMSHMTIPGIKPFSAAGLILESGYLDIPKLIDGINNILCQKKQMIVEDLDYSSMEFQNERFEIRNLISAKNVIFCEGAAVINNPWFKNAGFHPNKGEIIEIESETIDFDGIIRDKVFLLPSGINRYKVGASYLHNQTNNLPEKKNLPLLTSKLEQLISIPYTITDHKAGMRPAVKDRMPVLGSHPLNKNLMIMNGMGSKGVVYAPYCANIMMNYLTNENYSIPQIINVQRYLKN